MCNSSTIPLLVPCDECDGAGELSAPDNSQHGDIITCDGCGGTGAVPARCCVCGEPATKHDGEEFICDACDEQVTAFELPELPAGFKFLEVIR
jgi:RecJ-like exonuclease